MRKPLFITVISLFIFVLIFGSCENPENSAFRKTGLEQNDPDYPNPEKEKPGSNEENADPGEERADPDEESADPDEEDVDPDEGNADPGEENVDPGEEDDDPGEEDSSPGGENAEETIPELPGKLLITLFPGEFTHYTLSFVHQSGDTADDLKLPKTEKFMVELAAGLWTITAVGYTSPGTGEPIPAARGQVQARVVPENTGEISIPLDKILGGEGSRGTLSYSVEFPRDLVRSALLTLSLRDEGGAFRPCFITDLLENAAGDSSEGALSLLPGCYRLDLSLNALYPGVSISDTFFVYPFRETRMPGYHIEASEFLIPETLYGTVALRAYLDGLKENTKTEPYLINLGGVDLGTSNNTTREDTLKALYTSLSYFTALDLSACTGESITSILVSTVSNKAHIAALILPPSVKELSAGAFEGCAALAAVYMPGVSTFSQRTFNGCTSLESVYMPEITSIKNTAGGTVGAFNNCTSLKSVYLPRALTIERETFKSCKALSVVYLPQVNTFDDGVFADCTVLDCLILGENPPKLGKEVFKDSNLRTIYVPYSAMDTYKNTTQPGWTDVLKEKVRPLPENN